MLECLHPVITRSKSFGMVLGLDSMKALLEELNHPENSFKIIHIAGTNGKGSTSTFIRYALCKAGYKVGAFNSPAVFDICDQIMLGSDMISEDDLYHVLDEVMVACDSMVGRGLAHPTEFEIFLAAALLYFKNHQVDIAIIEAGLGGKFDATNAIEHKDMCVFTSISMDHMQILGDNLYDIAYDKAHILREHVIAISQIQDKEAKRAISDYANLINSEVEYLTETNNSFELKMIGTYQLHNASLAYAALKKLTAWGMDISDDDIRDAFKNAFIAGRMQRIKESPDIYIDGAHNAAASIELASTIVELGIKPAMIVGILKDKEVGKIIDALGPVAANIYTITVSNSRALSASELAEQFKLHGFDATSYNSIGEAYHAAHKDGFSSLVACGSLYYLKEFVDIINKEG